MSLKKLPLVQPANLLTLPLFHHQAYQRCTYLSNGITCTEHSLALFALKQISIYGQLSFGMLLSLKKNDAGLLTNERYSKCGD